MTQSTVFFIKDGYLCNDTARTYETSHIGEYWTEERIHAASLFQYHVYRLAARIAKENHCRIGLDLGCGPATKAKTILAPVLDEIYLVDQPNSELLVTAALPDAHFIGTDLESCNLSIGQTMDLIVCADVLEHLFDPSACLDFALQHLKSSGIAIFSTPERDILRGSECMNSPHASHVREWNGREFKQLLEYMGFRVMNQKLLPATRLPAAEDCVRILGGGLLRPRRWTSCQVAICTK